jgi:NAD(P)-dependent dehydrogenase (short-subunit alcohol dehydrogenase family)
MKKLVKLIKDGKIDLVGKRVAISGATGGIGRELCTYFAKMGAELLLLDRNEARSNALRSELMVKFSDIHIEHITLDLENIENVKSVAEQLEREPVDYLVLNAGAYSSPRHKCSTGYDNVFQINFVSPYYLARRLLPSIRARGGKVVAVGSIAHNYSKIDPDDVDFSGYRKASKVYGNAKRHLMFSFYALDPSGETVSVTHPGITQTNITAHYPKLIYALIKYPMRVIFMRPRRACLSILCGLFEGCAQNEWIGPRVFDIWGLPSKKTLRTCSQSEAKDIIARAEDIYIKIEG